MQLVHDAGVTAASRPRTAKRQPSVVKSAVRVIEVLEFFDRTRMPAPVGQVSTALCFPQSSTSALLRSLTKIGYLRYDPETRTYFPTVRVPLLGNSIAQPWFRGGPLLELMDDLAERSGLHVALARRNGDHAQYVNVTDPQDTARLGVMSGAMVPLASSAAGQLLLAEQSDQEVRRLMHRLNAEVASPADIVRISELQVLVADARRRGYVFINHRSDAALAFRLPRDPDSSPLALVLLGDPESLTKRLPALLTMMREAIARRLKPAPRILPDLAVPPEFACPPLKQIPLPIRR